MHAGLEQCRNRGIDAVVVLFTLSITLNLDFCRHCVFCIGCEYEVPDEAFMVLELKQGIINGSAGKVRYHDAFNSL